MSGIDQAGWLLPHFLGKPQWLTGAILAGGQHLAVLVDGVAVLLLWRWKGLGSAKHAQAAPTAAAALS